jgi:hypothetical protein
MKINKFCLVIFCFISTLSLAQNASFVTPILPPMPNPIIVGQTGTGSVTLRVASPITEVGEFAMAISSGNTAYVVSAASLVSGPITNGFEPFDTSDPTTAFAYQIAVLPPGDYVFTYTIAPTGTEADPVGTTMGFNFGGATGQATPNVTLPVTLTSFNVTKEGSKVATLSWKTTEETNSDYFEVQHSLNAKDWEAVGKVQSHNDGKAIHNYTFSYAGKTNGKNYFRLNMVDLDGTSQRSSVRSVTFENLAEEMVSFGPNPTSDYLNIKLSDWSTVKSVSILDKMGRNVYSSGAKPENTISVRNFNSGLYLLKLTRNNGEVIVNKILVNK